MTPSLTPVHFLLVDDLEENLLSLGALLQRDGLVLLKARSGDEALELLLRHDVALALVDVQMPSLDGFELAELMRGNARTRHVPIIFVTAGSFDKRRRFRGYEAGAVDFIYKPIEPDILRGKADVFFELDRQRQQLAAQRDELQAHAQALDQADRRKDEFLATLAHELRNPLAPLRYGLDMLRADPARANEAQVPAMMDRQLLYLVRLIDDLLDVSRVSQGKIQLRKELIQISDVFRLALETSQPLVDSAGHQLKVGLASEPMWIDADPTRIAQVVSNLLNNAAKYTPAGGHIGLSASRDGEDVVIAVSDDGIGIAPDMQSSVFQLFSQIDNNVDRTRGGLGIGLALVKQLVSMHGGMVELRSEGVGKGSTFTVRLPLAETTQHYVKTGEAEQEAEPSTPDQLKVLIVDDNVDSAVTLGLILETSGHSCRLVHDGHGVLQAAEEFSPDAVLLDIGLPGMDGYAVCRQLRQHERFSKVLIIAQTGWGQIRDKNMADAAGFDHHLVKPLLIDELEQLLANYQRADLRT